MSLPHRVCLLGFSDFERRALALQFRLAASRAPAYELVAAPEQARYLLVDADASSAVQRTIGSGRVGDALFVGGRSAPAGALAVLRRPIDALSLLRELDAAVMRDMPPAAPSAAPPVQGAASPVAPDSPSSTTRQAASGAPRDAGRGAPAGAAHKAAPGGASAMPPDATRPPQQALRPAPSAPARPDAAPQQTSAAPEPDSQLADLADLFPDRAEAPKAAAKPKDARCDALLVDDSEIALRFLEIKLGELGLRSRTATTSDDALAQLAQHDFTYVFVDVELGQHSRMDGLALCRHIKRNPRHKRAPLVALVSAHASQTDRARGSLAGCDAYLGKPLAAHELAAVVSLRRMR